MYLKDNKWGGGESFLICPIIRLKLAEVNLESASAYSTINIIKHILSKYETGLRCVLKYPKAQQRNTSKIKEAELNILPNCFCF